jgi:xanthine dehydrogenase accessory factor
VDDDHSQVYEALLQAQSDGVTAALATVVSTRGSMPRHAGSKMLVYADGRIVGTVGGGAMEARVIAEATEAINDGQTRLRTYTLNNLEDGDPGICGGSAQIFIEAVNAAPTLLVIGCGHCGKALAELGKWMGYRVIVSDDRADLCTEANIPSMDGYINVPPSEIPGHVNITANTYVAAVTRGLPVDVNLIPALLQTPAPYIGLIGSKRRWALTIQALMEQHDLDLETLKRVRAPIGLEIEAETPKEIALSIMAEIVMVRRGGTGEPMQWHGDLSKVELVDM